LTLVSEMNESDLRQVYIESARREYGDAYEKLKWITPEQSSVAAEKREKLLLWIQSQGAQIHCGGTKLVCHGLSPGCRLCMEGEWSCLFINNICNGRCFFCPTDQSDIDVPTTQTIQFTDPQDYVDYIGKFGFKGVSISGGEPLLSFDRTIDFISAVKSEFGQDIHLWLYTNGILLTPDKLISLNKAGVDEIRFNIYASHNFLEKITMAAGLIKDATVEIPAIPELFEELKNSLSDMKQAGVHYLNLHQLRLTPHNYPHLAKRDYTYLPGPKITVLESELEALKIMKFNIESGINLPINYCSFPYKNVYQRNAERRRHSPYIMKPYEDLTEAGMIRSMQVKGHPEQVKSQLDFLKKSKIKENLWEVNSEGDCLLFNRECFPYLDFKELTMIVRYYDTAIRPTVSYRNMFKEIRLNNKKKVVIERWPVSDEIELNLEDILWFGREYLNTDFVTGNKKRSNNPQQWNRIKKFELIWRGLSDYY